MQPLIDGDVILYEVGFAAEAAWKFFLAEKLGDVNVPIDPPPFDFVYEILENRIANICAVAGATEAPLIYFTGKENFRYEIALSAPYKERLGVKPFHYYNIKTVLQFDHQTFENPRLEADDLIAIEMHRRPGEVICCTRDKDLRAVPGWHFGWELNNQPQFGPMLVEGFGEIMLSPKRDKIIGWGEKFFWSQMMTGDPVDTIPGIPKCGAVGAFKVVGPCLDSAEAFKSVSEAYRASYGDRWADVMLEQGRLLHMTRELHEDGSPVLWELPCAPTQ